MKTPHDCQTAAAAVARTWRNDLRGIPRASTVPLQFERADLERLTTLAEAVAGLGAAVDGFRQIVERFEQAGRAARAADSSP